MGLFSKSEPKKEQVSIVKWNDVNTVALNSFNTDGIEFSNSVKMTVEANQAAFFATRNGIIKTFNEGSHPISTNDIKKIQDGNVTVYFITTQTIPIVRWHTGNVRLKGGEYEISGTYSFQITDVQAFMDNIVLASDVVMSETDLFKKIEIFINENICKAIYESPNKVEDFIGNSQSLQEICFKNIQDGLSKGGITISNFEPQIEQEEDMDYKPAQVISFVTPKTEKKSLSCTDLQAKYTAIIHKCFDTIMQNKKKDDYFTLSDGEKIVDALLAVVKKDYVKIPPEIKASCDLSMAIIAPTTLEKTRYIKSAVGVAGGMAGIGSVIGALGMVLGWGGGILFSIKAFFVGVSLTGPIALAIGGLTIAGIATYFAFSKEDPITTAQKFKEALCKQVEKAVESTWNEHKDKFL